jgi:para-nitrobenzyl esterase
MGQYWTNFAKTGNPNGVDPPKWPRYGASAEDVMELGDKTGPMPVLDPERKALFDAYLATPCRTDDPRCLPGTFLWAAVLE